MFSSAVNFQICVWTVFTGRVKVAGDADQHGDGFRDWITFMVLINYSHNKRTDSQASFM